MLGAVLPLNANAGTVTSSMALNATIVNSCAINSVTNPSTPTLTAGGSAAQVSGSIYVQCTSGDTYNLEFGPGMYGTDGATPTRYLAGGSGGANRLQYQIYQNSNYTTPWGDTIGTNTYARAADGTSQGFGVYVQINAPPWTFSAGSYTDTVNITVSY